MLRKVIWNKTAEIIQGFTNAIYKGQKWVKRTYSSRNCRSNLKTFSPDTDVEMLEAAVQSYIDIDAWKSDTNFKKESFDLLQTVMKEAGN